MSAEACMQCMHDQSSRAPRTIYVQGSKGTPIHMSFISSRLECVTEQRSYCQPIVRATMQISAWFQVRQQHCTLMHTCCARPAWLPMCTAAPSHISAWRHTPPSEAAMHTHACSNILCTARSCALAHVVRDQWQQKHAAAPSCRYA